MFKTFNITPMSILKEVPIYDLLTTFEVENDRDTVMWVKWDRSDRIEHDYLK